MSNETTSTSSPQTIAISPSFSSDSTSSAPHSEPTSDEQPDLGAFTTVLRAWTYLQPHPRIPPPPFPSSSSSRTYRADTSSISSFTRPGTSVATGTESPLPEVEGSTVWNQRRIQSYLDLYSGTPTSDRLDDDEDLEEEDEATKLSSNAAHNNEGEYSPRSPPRSPAVSLASTDGARTVEIISELDVHDTVTFDDSISNDQSLMSGEISVPVHPLDHRQLSTDDMEGEDSSLTSREVPLHYGPHVHPGNGRASPPPKLFRHVPSEPVSTFHPVSVSQQSTSRQYQSTSASQHLQSISQNLRSNFDSDSQHSTSQFISPFQESSAQTSQQYLSQADPDSISSSNFSVSSYNIPQSFGPSPSVLNESCSSKSRSLFTESHSSALTLTPENYRHHDHSLLPTPDSGTHSLESHTLSLWSQAPLDSHTRSQSHDSHSPQSNGQSVVIEPLDSVSQLQSDSPYVLDDPLSPLPTPELEPSETFPFLPAPAQHIVEPLGSSFHTPKRRQGVGYEPEGRTHDGHGQNYPHSLIGQHYLPSTNTEVSQRSTTVENDATSDDIHSYDNTFHSEPEHEDDYEDGQPSLGYLDEALSFIAEERARWTAAREHGGEAGQGGVVGQGDWRHVIEPHRKRRRKKPLQKGEEGNVTPSVRPLLVPASPTALATDPETTTITAIGTVTAVVSPGKKKKIRLKKKASVASGLVGLADNRSAIVGHGENDTLLRPISILRPPAAPETDGGEEEDGGNGARTPTSGINLMGKKGKRVGRKEREKEKAKKDKEREKSQIDGVLPKLPGNLEDEFEFTFELENDEDEDEDDEDEDEDIAFSSSSNSGQPSVGLKRGENAHIHRSLTAGVYKSTPPTPGTRTPKVRGPPDVAGGILDESGPKPKEKKKKPRTRASKTLIHSQSFPNLKVDDTLGEGSSDTGGQGKKETKGKERKREVAATAPEIVEQDKRSRLIGLARKLQQLFPEQQADLGKVVNRLQNRSQRRGGPEETNSVANSNGKRGKGHVRTESADTELPEGDEDQMEAPDGSEEFDPRGRPPRKGDTLIHVFVDHSNILIGLLSHLKRHPPLKPIRIIGRPLPAIPKKPTHTRSLSNSKSTPASAFSAVKPSSSRPLPIPTNGKKKPVPVPVPAPVLDLEGTDTYPIPLPSFATAARKNGMESRSLPSGSILNTYMNNKAGRDEDETNSDGYSTGDRDELVIAPRWPKEGPGEKEKRTPRHMWHAALALILERGRPVTRRVIVASSPLYQPMDGIERLGYEVRVYIRVPDLGDGMDRERHKDRDFKNGSGKSSGGNKSVQSSPSKGSLWSASTPNKGLGHKRHLSGSTSAESGSGAGGKVAQLLGSSNLKPHYESTPSLVNPKVKYREQGVDELLQLKLHQALAATDEVPEGATIVLATGDGNVGQFNEDGFLGPVRTALRRGWKVELYAWEDGLSRSWRREFGEGSEWGRKGMFRIIGMEQFASGLVESA